MNSKNTLKSIIPILGLASVFLAYTVMTDVLNQVYSSDIFSFILHIGGFVLSIAAFLVCLFRYYYPKGKR